MNAASNNIVFLILFGSYARGDFNDNSDIDICLIIKDNDDFINSNEQWAKFLGFQDFSKLNLTIYTESRFKLMISDGSLFIWHLKEEGKIILGNKDYFQGLMVQLKRFNRHKEEFIYHKDLITDIEIAQSQFNQITILDFSLLYSIIRNVLILLSDKFGKPIFSRVECYNAVKRTCPKLPISFSTYQELEKFKMSYDRMGTDIIPQLDKKLFDYYSSQTLELLDFALNLF